MEEREKLRILAAGDIHGDSLLCHRLAKKAVKENVDLVVLAGDLTFFEQSTEGIIGPFAEAGKKVLLLHGNHDELSTLNFLTDKYSNAHNLHDKSLKLRDVGIFGAGGTTQIGPLSVTSEENMYKRLKHGLSYVDDSRFKVMITHEHPANTKMGKAFSIPGSQSIENAIKSFKPNIALCSHLHEAWGMEEKIGDTLLVNVGREGKIFEI